MIPRRLCLAAGMILLAAALSYAQPPATCSDFRVSRDPQEAIDASACLDGPVFGFTFNEVSGRLSPILGIPGTLRLDNPLDLGLRLDAAQFSDKHTYGLAISSGDRKVLSLAFRDRIIYVRDTGLPSDPGKTALGASGNFAALFYPALRQIFVSHLPDATVAWIADASAVPDDLVALSISDDGSRMLAGTAAGSAYVFTNDGAVRLVAGMTTPAIIRFLRNSHDAIIADRTEMRLYFYSESVGAAWSFASETEGISSPIDVAISDANNRVFVVNDNSSNIVAIEIATAQATSIDCNCLPRKLAAVQGSTLFEITNVTDSSLLLFQPTMAGGDILFAPTTTDISSAQPPPDAEPTSTPEPN